MIAFIALWFFFQYHVVHAETTGKINGDLRIVGGTDADAFPTLAFSAGSKLCGATLIYPECVLLYHYHWMNIEISYSTKHVYIHTH